MQGILRRNAANNLIHNIFVNVSDGAFFGFGLGVASYVTVIPLFVATFTESPILIGLITAMHEIGWYLPQLFTAERVARLRRFKPMALTMTFLERVPFFAMTAVALLSPTLGGDLTLFLFFLLVIWQSFAGGFTATAWQSMITKIMPLHRRGTFYGLQSSAANLLGSGGAVLAGVILKGMEAPQSFALCFFICGIAMFVSFGFLAMTREEESDALQAAPKRDMTVFVANLKRILRTDANFRWFLLARMLAIFASMGLIFYSVFAVRSFGVDEGEVGVMTGILMLGTVFANPVLGWAGDRWSHREMYAFSVFAATLSAVIAIFAPSTEWLYLGFIVLGVAKAGLWMIPMPLTVQFGESGEHPYYIGLANTLIAPAAIAAPIIGGALSDTSNFDAAFALAVIAGILSVLVLLFVVKEPKKRLAVV